MTEDTTRVAVDAQQDGSEPGPTPADAAVAWEELLATRQFGAAYRAFRVARSLGLAELETAAAEAVQRSLAALADVEEFVRERAFERASERLALLEEPFDLAPWAELEADLAALTASAKLLDERDSEGAIAALEPLTDSWLTAEVEAQRGTAHIFAGRLDEARASFERSIAVDPQHYRALTNLGNVALEEQRTDDAIAFYQQALKVNDNFANAHHNLGVAYRRKGQLGLSVRELKAAQRLTQRKEASEARAKLGRIGGGVATSKWLRWFLIGGAGAILYYLFLRN